MKSQITTHILDTSTGKPASGVNVSLFYQGQSLASSQTNDDGRILQWLPTDHVVQAGVYQIVFEVGDWMKSQNRACFYPSVKIDFEIIATNEHYHVPLLINPFGYSTYRGS
jgi:5-hydroxyisourate hydrolase